jgi:hypothetical protein
MTNGFHRTDGQAMPAERAMFLVNDADLPFLGKEDRRANRDTLAAGNTFLQINFNLPHFGSLYFERFLATVS